MPRMTSSGGRRRAPRARFSRGAVALHALGLALSVAAWIFLVGAAVDFGATARGGDGQAWIFCLVAAAGAAVCLLLAMVLAGRALVGLGVVEDYRPPSRGARRR